MAQFRCGILPVRIETGRFTNEPPHERFCKLCNDGSIEDEEHFLFHCDAFKIHRETFYHNIGLDKNAHVNSNLQMLMENNQRQTSKFINELFQFRKQQLYKKSISTLSYVQNGNITVTYRSILAECNKYIALNIFYCFYVKRNAHVTIINDLLTYLLT
jgi:hypothetical protein